MKWDQIESKWALMTRRIRADFGGEHGGATEVSVRTLERRDPLTPRIADSRAFTVEDAGFKTPAE